MLANSDHNIMNGFDCLGCIQAVQQAAVRGKLPTFRVDSRGQSACCVPLLHDAAQQLSKRC